MKALIAAVERGARSAASGMTSGIREHAESMGWDPSIARTLRVQYSKGAFVVTSPRDAALDEEYGNSSGSGPKPAIRTYDSKGLATARLRKALDDVAEAVL